jgi:hypothetical protein
MFTFVSLFTALLTRVLLSLASRDIIISRYDIDAKESFKARAVYTQLSMVIKVI